MSEEGRFVRGLFSQLIMQICWLTNVKESETTSLILPLILSVFLLAATITIITATTTTT